MTRDQLLPDSVSFSTFLYMFQLKRASRKHAETIPDAICFFNESVIKIDKVRVVLKDVQGDCELFVMRWMTPTFLACCQRKCAPQESCRIPWVHFPFVFPRCPRLAFRSDCEFTCDEAI